MCSASPSANDVFRSAIGERCVPLRGTIGRDAHFVRDVRFARGRDFPRNTSHHFAAQPQTSLWRSHSITAPSGATSLFPLFSLFCVMCSPPSANDVFRSAIGERCVPLRGTIGRDASFGRDVRFARGRDLTRNTSHHFAAKPQTSLRRQPQHHCAAGATSLRRRRNITFPLLLPRHIKPF